MRSCISETQTIGNWSDVAPALSLSNPLNCSYLHSNKKIHFFSLMSSVEATHIRITAKCEGEVRAEESKPRFQNKVSTFQLENGAEVISLSHTLSSRLCF